ncbi:MAG: CAP domain-containing protein [Myxococcaceae bacterium]
MPLSLLLAGLLSAPGTGVTPLAFELRARAEVLRQFDAVGRTAPIWDPALDRAAARLAADALAHSATSAADPASIAQAVSDAQGHDPSPRALLLRGAPATQAFASLAARRDLNEEHATHGGVAVATRGDDTVFVVLLANRRANLEPFTRHIEALGDVRPLCGALRQGFASPNVFVTRPTGRVERIPLTRTQGASFCTLLSFPNAGKHHVEIVATETRGPEVVALFEVEVGPKPQISMPDDPRLGEPTSLVESREVILVHVNALRGANGLSPVHLDDRLNALAQAYSEQMAKEHFFAHLSPQGATLSERLGAAVITYKRAGENLGLAEGPLAAHRGIERSPGHRKNLIDAEFDRMGVGVAFEQVNGRKQAIVVEVLTAPAVPVADPSQLVFQSVVRRRSELQLPTLRRSPELDALAKAHAERAIAANVPNPMPESATLEQRVFQALSDAETAAVDVFVAPSPQLLPESRSLRRAENDRVGVGAVRAQNTSTGREEYWVVLIYAGAR